MTTALVKITAAVDRIKDVLKSQVILEETAQFAQRGLAEQVEWSFARRVDANGSPWAPLKQASRSKGTMKREAIGAIVRGSTSARGFASQEYTEPFYWPFQNFGTRQIPARPFFDAGDELLTKTAEFGEQKFAEAIERG